MEIHAKERHSEQIKAHGLGHDEGGLEMRFLIMEKAKMGIKMTEAKACY